MELDGAGLRVLTWDECLTMLATAQIGRIAVSAQALPHIFPVRFLLGDDGIVIRTHQGTTLGEAARDAVVAFEADGPIADSAFGWSVIVQGVARQTADLGGLAEHDVGSLPSWSPQRPANVVMISIELMAGRASLDAALPSDLHRSRT
jgi:uncharacterized protein